jgi:catechol 2,3-dioxygenase-like lactoylglutathione lyase family enzyme
MSRPARAAENGGGGNRNPFYFRDPDENLVELATYVKP